MKRRMFVCIMLVLALIVPVNGATPRWSNIAFFSGGHGYSDNGVCCEVDIQGWSGTEIRDIEIQFIQLTSSGENVIKTWNNFPNAEIFRFCEYVTNVETGFTYRLTVFATVWRGNSFEPISGHWDREY